MPNFFLFDDNANSNLPNFSYNWRAVVENKSIPFINFHQFLSQRFLGQGYTAVLYSPVYIAIWLSKTIFHNNLYAIDILVITHLLASTIAMCLLLKRLKHFLPLACLAAYCGLLFPILYLHHRPK